MIFKKMRDSKSQAVIDIHSHILPGLDDGAQDMTETLAMLRIAADEGITDIIATPHFRPGRYRAAAETVLQTLWKVQKAVEKQKIPIRLYPGNEVYYFNELPLYLRENRVLTLNGSRHVLIEFSPSVMFRTLQNALDSVFAAGYQPVLAHAERYDCLLKNAENAELIRDMGVQLQVNAATVTGKNGAEAKRFAHGLFKDGLADYIGTDAHSSRHRAPEIAKCRELLIKKYGNYYADLLLRDHAQELAG